MTPLAPASATELALRQQVLQLQQELDATGARYAALKRLVPIGFCSVDAQGGLTHASPSALLMLGLAADEVAGQPLQQFIAAQDQAEFQALCERVRQSGTPLSLELRMQERDGARFWARILVAMAPEPERGALWHLSLSNITRQKQSQTALEQSEERFRQLTELSSDWYWEQDDDLRFVRIAGGDAMAAGGMATGFLGHRLWEITAIMAPESGWATHQSLVRARLPFHELELRMPDRLGIAQWMALSGIPVRGPGGEFLGYRGIGRDVSSKREAARVRQEALDRLTKIASRVPGLVFQCRMRQDGSLSYPFVSDAIRVLFNLEPDQVRENTSAMRERVHPQDRDRMVAAIHASATHLAPFREEFRVLKPDGAEHWIRADASAEREPGGATLWHGFMSDVTERRQEQELVRTALREKSALLQEVHHRVKNNLQVVISLLRLEGQRATHPAVHAALDATQGRIRAMALLHESLYRTGVYASANLDVYLRELATQAFRAQAPADTRVRLQLALAPVRVGLNQGTPCGLIVNELISNALKHGFPQNQPGTVEVSLQPLAQTGEVCLQVVDSGIGFPAAGLPPPGGQSLGLQLVHDLARQLDATLELGPGSRVRLVFRPDEPAPAGPPP